MATAMFTNLPEAYTAFGKKKATITLCYIKQDEADYEVFYPAEATNHPDDDRPDEIPPSPNWFYYYKQNAGGGQFFYIPNGRSHSLSGKGDLFVGIGNEAYQGDKYITTSLDGGQLTATGWSGINKYYANFLGVLAHERHHAYNQTSSGSPNDSDGDNLSNDYETGTTHTDPYDKYSARGILVGPIWHDGEVYAGGPVEEKAVLSADTTQDWANPGSNSK